MALPIILLLAVLAYSAALPSGQLPTLPSLQDITIQELGHLLDSGAITSYDLTNLYIKRINSVNNELHAVIEVSNQALTVARQLDKDRTAGHKRGPLHGIPILVKDNFATVDDMATGSGSVCLARSYPRHEATVISKLRKAGAIILGKTNLSEFAGGRGSASEGWSPRGNQTFGAYVEDQTPCGSSSGSGVAASLGLAAATLGTDTAGSITCPASYNNVVGIKPTVGLTSRYGTVPLIPRQDTVGPITQNVADAALILEVIAGRDSHDNYTLAQPGCAPPSYTSVLDSSALRGKRIGAFFAGKSASESPAVPNEDQIRKVFEDALADLTTAGAEIVRVDLGLEGVPLANSSSEVTSNIFRYALGDFALGLAAYMEDLSPELAFDELLQCLKTDPAEMASTIDMSQIGAALQTNQDAGGVEAWTAFTTAVNISREVLLGPIRDSHLDGLVMFSDAVTLLAAAPGLPVVTVPMGALGDDAVTQANPYGTTIASGPGIPLGLSFIGDSWMEEDLIGFAYSYEQVSKKRRTLVPYAEIEEDLASILRAV